MERIIENNYLFDQISVLNGKQYLIIVDFYHTNNIPEVVDEINTLAKIDTNIVYLIFSKGETVYKGLNENVFVEYRLANIHFIVGFAIAKTITVYMFTNEIDTSWLKMKDKNYENFLKFSEFAYIKVTMEYMLRDKKRNATKPPSKLNQLFMKETKQPDQEKKQSDIKETFVFKNLFETIRKHLVKSNPKNIQSIENIIYNYCEQNIKNFNCSENDLSFMMFTRLLHEGVIINPTLNVLIENKYINSYSDILKLQTFEVAKIDDNQGIHEEQKHKTSKRKKNHQELFSLSDKGEEEYIKLLQNSPTICNFVKNIISKIFNSINLSAIDKLPNNPYKYKNYIYSFLDNQELRHISKRILILDYPTILSTLTEGIIIELMKNNLIVILSDSKVFYNIVQIEQEKFRLLNK